MCHSPRSVSMISTMHRNRSTARQRLLRVPRLLLRGAAEAVSAPTNGGNDLGIGGVRFQLQTQSLDECTKVVPLVCVRRTPNALQQGPVTEHLVRMPRQLGQEKVLRG